MRVIFCADPVVHSEPDPLYIDEVAAATHAGCPFYLIDYKALVQDDNPARAVRDVPVHQPIEDAVYRGWDLTVRQYKMLYDALLSRGLRLINAPDAFRQTHHLPEFLPLIEAHTPRTVWIHSDGKHINDDAVMHALDVFAGRPVILRDFVRTLKHYWVEACYISSSSDATAVKNTIAYFLDKRRDSLVGGLVFREYVDFETISDDLRGGKPIINEYRLLWLKGECIATLCYWDEETSQTILPDEATIGQFADVVAQFDSQFCAMDIARRPDGTWQILEMDDAQIIALPESAPHEAIYQALARYGV
jgi:hypothetical protein